MQSIDGFLLTRQWRDTREGVELSFWAATSEGPLRLSIPAQKAVCFVECDATFPLPDGTTRKPLDLQLMGGTTVDALYFSQQRHLSELRRHNLPLCESDVKPTERYMMERFVNAGFEATGEVQRYARHLEMINPKLRPKDFLPSLKILSLDIETRGMTDQLYSIGAACTPESAVFMLDSEMDADCTQRPQEGYTLFYCKSEKLLLLEFFNWLEEHDPDVIVGWAIVNFDLDFLHRKCQSLGLPFALARCRESATVLQPSRDGGSEGGPRVARVPGRPVLDGIDLLKAGFWSFESFALDNVAHELLGKRKLITADTDKVAEINRLFRDNKPQLADYNMQDCRLVIEIFEKANLLAFAMQRAQITGLAIDRMGGSVAAFDHLYLPRLHRMGFVANDLQNGDGGLGSPGGYVMDSQPGLYENVLVLDFKSLYPSIIRTFFIDPLGLALGLSEGLPERLPEGETAPPLATKDVAEPRSSNNCTDSDDSSSHLIKGFEGASFSRDKHILPGLIEQLWQARDQAKLEKNAALSQAIKIIMNSFYGVLGSSGCRFYSQQLASSITLRGHEIITRSRDFIEQQGYSVIYGDTDSVFVLLAPELDETQSAAIGDHLMTSLNQWWQNTLLSEHNLRSELEVEFETHYLRFLMPTVRGMTTGSKKRYAGLIRGSNNELELIFKGLEAVRTDWTPIAREFQRELYRRIFLKEPFEDFVRETALALQNGERDEQLVYRKRLRRKLSDYQRNVPPHVQAARKQKKAGHWVSYIITRNGPEPTDALESQPDYQHYMDRQLAPAADSILHFMDTSFATITDAQMQMF